MLRAMLEIVCCSKWDVVISSVFLATTVIVSFHSPGGKDKNAFCFYMT
jgi:hypothetical protein